MSKNRKRKVAIDIGHGANTFPPGKGVYKGGKGYAEHDFNSKVAIRLDELLKANNIDTLMYQKPFSPDIPLGQRTRYYNQQKVDLVWSIHANASSSSKANGRCSFYWHTSRAGKKLAYIFADQVKKAGYSTHGDGTHASMRGSWTNLHICRETRMPAVLTENGFMTGDKDFDLVFGSKQAEYVEDIAIIHAKSICEFFGVQYRGSGVKPSKPTKKPASKPTSKPKTPSKPSGKGNMKTDSIVTYLNSIEQDSSYGNRKKLAAQHGIKGYKGSGSQNTRLLNILRKGGSTPKKTSSRPKANLRVDGYMGVNTIRALQRYYGTPVDGRLSKPSLVIRKLQATVGSKIDGYMGVNTIRAMQRRFGTPVDGRLSRPSVVIKELQRRLNRGKL